MKIVLVSSIAALALGVAANSPAADYSVFKVCNDEHVIHTSDGGDAGHIEYIVIDPSDQRIVSTVVGGGAMGDRYVTVPYEDVSYGEQNTIVLNQITRERLASAPVFERTKIVQGGRLDQTYVQQSVTYFGGGRDRGNAGGNARAVGREGDRPGAELKRGSGLEGAAARDGAHAGVDVANEPGRAGAETGRPGIPAGRPGGEAAREAGRPGAAAPDASPNGAESARGTGRATTGTETEKEGARAGAETTKSASHAGTEATRNTERGEAEATHQGASAAHHAEAATEKTAHSAEKGAEHSTKSEKSTGREGGAEASSGAKQ